MCRSSGMARAFICGLAYGRALHSARRCGRERRKSAARLSVIQATGWQRELRAHGEHGGGVGYVPTASYGQASMQVDMLCLDRRALHRRPLTAPAGWRRDVDRLGPAGEGEAHAAVLLHLAGAGDGGILIALQVREADHRGGEKRAAIAQAPDKVHVLL